MGTCNHDCESCKEKCKDEIKIKRAGIKKPNDVSNIKKIIGVTSGKGGVGKSLVTSMLASHMSKLGYKVAILDADITGPSIPKIFGACEKAENTDKYIMPVKTAKGIDIMSINLLLDSDTDPVIWRGPIIAGTVKQFYDDVMWGDIDYMFIDMPPGTGDVPLTIFQSVPVDGIVVVTSPQDLVSMIVKKSVNMAKAMNIPLIGVIENMSYFRCPDNNKDYNIFGDSKADSVAKEFGLDVLAKLPINPEFAKACDAGKFEELELEILDGIEKFIG